MLRTGNSGLNKICRRDSFKSALTTQLQSHLALVERHTLLSVRETAAKIMLNILGNTVQNFVALADGRPGSLHPYNNASALLPLIY